MTEITQIANANQYVTWTETTAIYKEAAHKNSTARFAELCEAHGYSDQLNKGELEEAKTKAIKQATEHLF